MLFAAVCKPLVTWIITLCFSLLCGPILDSIKNLAYGHIGVMVQSFQTDTDQKFFCFQSIMSYNGGAVLAMKGKKCVAIAADKRFGIQAQTLALDFQVRFHH